MFPAARVLPFAVVAAALIAACADVTSPNHSASPPASALASKGSGSGGSGGGGGSGGTQLVVTTPPTVDATGTWVGTSDGPDVTHTYTFYLTQTTAGMVSGTASSVSLYQTAWYSVVGTVNADTLMLYVGTACSSCTLTPLYRGIVSATASRIDGSFLNGGVSPVTMFKQ